MNGAVKGGKIEWEGTHLRTKWSSAICLKVGEKKVETMVKAFND